MHEMFVLTAELAAAAVIALYVAFWFNVAVGAVRIAGRFFRRLVDGGLLSYPREDIAVPPSLSLLVLCYAPDCLGLRAALTVQGPLPRTPTPMEMIMRTGRDPRFVPCRMRKPKTADEVLAHQEPELV